MFPLWETRFFFLPLCLHQSFRTIICRNDREVHISFILPKAANRPATPDDLKTTAKETYIGVEVVMDGRVMSENLSRMGRNKNWLEKQIKSQGHKEVKEIFLGIYRPEEDKLTLYLNE